jgi:hypothetical protein
MLSFIPIHHHRRRHRLPNHHHHHLHYIISCQNQQANLLDYHPRHLLPLVSSPIPNHSHPPINFPHNLSSKYREFLLSKIIDLQIQAEI